MKLYPKIVIFMEEIFIWYFEQKGVENPERFLGVNNEGVNDVNSEVSPQADNAQQAETVQQTENITPAEGQLANIPMQMGNVAQIPMISDALSRISSKLKHNRENYKTKKGGK